MSTDIDGHGADSRAQHTAIGPGTEDRASCRACHAVLWQLLCSRANGAASGNAVGIASTGSDSSERRAFRSRSAASGVDTGISLGLESVGSTASGGAEQGEPRKRHSARTSTCEGHHVQGAPGA